MTETSIIDVIRWTVYATVFVYVVAGLPIVPIQRCIEVLGWQVACNVKYVTILQYILGR